MGSLARVAVAITPSAIVRAGLPLMAVFLVAGCNHTHGSDVVASVNGHSIMRADMDRMYKLQLGQAQAQGQGSQPSAEQADSLRLQIVHELIQEEVVAQRAASMNLSASQDDVDANLAEIKAPLTEEQFNQQLQAAHQTLDDYKRDLRRKLTIEKLMNKEIVSKITISDADVANFYNQNKAHFDPIEPMYHLAEIRVTGVPSPQPVNLQNSKATTDAEAKRKIDALKSRLDSGEDFGTIAENFSENQNSSSGGDMGFVPESQLRGDPTVYAALAKLKPGQYTDVLALLDPATKKPSVYVIVKLLSREPAGQRDLNDPAVQQTIRQQLRDDRTELLKSAYVEMLDDQAKVENFFAQDLYTSGAK